MNMREFSNKVGLSSHTLRYYEKIGLLKISTETPVDIGTTQAMMLLG